MAAEIVTLKSCNEEEKENNHSEEFSSRLNDEGFDGGCQDVIIVMVAVVDAIVVAVAVVLVVVTLI